MSEPTTAEGRALLDELPDAVVAGGSVAEYVLAIEAAAAEAERVRIRAALDQLQIEAAVARAVDDPEHAISLDRAIHAVLAAIGETK